MRPARIPGDSESCHGSTTSLRDAHLAHLQQAWRAVLRQHPEAVGELSFFLRSNDGLIGLVKKQPTGLVLVVPGVPLLTVQSC